MPAIGTKSFRQSNGYLHRFSVFGDMLRCHLELKELGKSYDALEPLMLEAYKFMKFIRKAGGLLTIESPQVRPVDTAIVEVMEILDEPLEFCVPLKYEADALECLSYSAWKVLKEKALIKHCRYCQAWLSGSCKKHKEAATVSGMYYCKGCTGFIESLCVVHGPELCDVWDGGVF